LKLDIEIDGEGGVEARATEPAASRGLGSLLGTARGLTLIRIFLLFFGPLATLKIEYARR